VATRLLPNINWVRAVICPAVVLIATGMDRGYQTDFWHHIARGREIALTGNVVDVDPMTFTVAGQTLRDANWLTQLAYYRLYELGGLPLVQTANSVVLALAAAVLVWICCRRGASVAVAAIVGVCAFAGIWQTLMIRPQSVSLLLFVVLYAILGEAERRRWLLIVPPLLLALWANLHGGFPISLLLIGAFGFATLAERWATVLRRKFFIAARGSEGDDEASTPFARRDADSPESAHATPPFDLAQILGIRRKQPDPALSIRGGAGMVKALIFCGVVSFAATLANPYGLGVYDYVFTLSKLASGRQVEEWLPPSMGLWVGRVWAASILGLIVLLAMTSRRPRGRDLFLAACFLPLACASVRMVPWWLLTVAPVFAMMLARNIAPDPVKRWAAPKPSLLAASMLLLIGSAVLLSLPSMERHNPVFGTLRPASRTESDLHVALDHIPEGRGDARVFTRLEWGEYVDWAAHPRGRAFMDGRIEIYPEDVWQQYHAVTAARADWQDILDSRSVNFLLLDTTFHSELLPRVRASEKWKAVSQSGPAVLFERREDGVMLTDVKELPQ
jgi:hypothetical protein